MYPDDIKYQPGELFPYAEVDYDEDVNQELLRAIVHISSGESYQTAFDRELVDHHGLAQVHRPRDRTPYQEAKEQ